MSEPENANGQYRPLSASTASPDAVAAPRRSLPPVQRWVFWPASAIIIVFVAFTLIAPDIAEALFKNIQTTIVNAFNWYYVLIAAVFVAFSLVPRIQSLRRHQARKR